jgi:hypothetical protein
VLEYLDNPGPVLDSLSATLKINGTLIVLVPHGQGLYGSLDRSMGHKRRYQSAELRRMLETHGFAVAASYSMNKAGSPPWWAYSKLFGSKLISKPTLKIFDKTVWLWSRVDRLIPWPGLSLITIARKREEPRTIKARQETMTEVPSRNAN